MLIEHRIHDVDEALIAREESVAASEQITLQPTLTHVLAQDLHHAPVRRQVLVDWKNRLHPDFICRLIDCVESIGGGFIRTEHPKVCLRQIELHHVTQKSAQDSGRFCRLRAGFRN